MVVKAGVGGHLGKVEGVKALCTEPKQARAGQREAGHAHCLRPAPLAALHWVRNPF